MKRFFSGYVYTWGDSYNFYLGHITRQPLYTPTRIDTFYKHPEINNLNCRLDAEHLRRDQPLKYKFSNLGTGPFHCGFVSDQGQIFTFGENNYMQLGHNATTTLAGRVSGLAGLQIKSMACGIYSSLALSSTGKVFSWGYGGENDSLVYSLVFHETPGPLGHGDFHNYYVPTIIERLDDIAQIQAGYYHGLALDSN